MGILGGIMKPVASVAQKAQKAGTLKSVKVKVKMKPGKADDKKADG